MNRIFLVMLFSFILSLILGFILIPILKNSNNYQRLSRYVPNKNKEHIPTMGGIIFCFSTIITMIVLYIFGKIKMSNAFLIVIITFIGYMLIGFIDDYLIIKKDNNAGLKEGHKLLLQLFLSIIFFLLFMLDNEPLIWIHSLNFKMNIGFLYGFFILLILVSSSNAVNITDGLDGLAGGLSLIAILTFGIISYHTEWLAGYEELTLFAFSLVGSLLGFLFFNFYPAKIFMGDTGSLALGGVLGSYAILTRHELLLILIGFVFVIETLSCVIQRIYYKFTKKRIFLMTPIHHTFEKKGFKEQDIVKMFWVFGLIFSLLSLCIGVWL